jgi:TPR repeat protein
MSKVKILVLSADPLADPENGRGTPLQLARNERQIREGVAKARYTRFVEIHTRVAAQTSDVMEALFDVRPQIVHFSGHGDRDGLVFVGPDGISPIRVKGNALGGLFEAFQDDIRLVVLSACHSHDDAVAIAAVVGCAIGTQGPIGDNAAISFDRALYYAIASGASVERAYKVACAKIGIDYPNPLNDPELVARPDVDPQQLVLLVPGPEDESRRQRWIALLKPRWTWLVIAAVVLATAFGARMMAFGWLASLAIGLLPLGATYPLLRNIQRSLRVRRSIAAASLVLWSALALWLFDGVASADTKPVSASAAPDADLCPASPTGASLSSTAPTTVDGAPGNSGFAVGRALFEAGSYAAAFPILKDAADRGEDGATAYVGLSYLCGLGVAPDPERGIDRLRKATGTSGERDRNAMVWLGLANEQGLGVDSQLGRAIDWFTKAVVEKGDAEAMRHLARLVLVDGHADSALALLRRAEGVGSLDAAVDIGYLYEQGLPRDRRDPAQARRLYLTAAQKGAVRGMLAMGRIHQAAGDFRAAREWYVRAADAGSADAMNNLGALYQRRGDGVRRSRLAAQRWYRRASDAGSTEAAANLAALRRG